MRRGHAGAGLILALTLWTLASCGGSDTGGSPATSAPPLPVALTIASPEAAPVWMEVTGTVEPHARVFIGTRVMGRATAVGPQAGDQVAKGDLLVTLNDADLHAAAGEAQAALAVVQARLEQARLQYERMARLQERGSATAKEAEDARAAWQVQMASLEQARERLAASQVNLGFAQILAPASGWVARRQVEVGDMVSPGQTLMILEDVSQVKIMLDVPQQQAVGLKAGDPVQIDVDGGGATVPATLSRVLPPARSGMLTFQAEVLLDNRDGALRAGMYARARFRIGTENRLLVAADNLVRRGALDGVFVVGDDRKARLRWLRLGMEHDQGYEVLAGLSDGERYVMAPDPALSDGAPVRAE